MRSFSFGTFWQMTRCRFVCLANFGKIRSLLSSSFLAILKSFLAIFNVSFQKLEFLSVPNFLLLRRTLEQKLYPWNKLCGGRPGLLVMRGEWQSRSREFESQQAPDSTRWIISSHSVVVKLDSVVWKKTENKFQGGRGWHIFWTSHRLRYLAL